MQVHRKSVLFRQVNDTIDEVLQRFGAEDAGSFFCECPRAACEHRLALTTAQYAEIREGGEFVLAPDCAIDVHAIAEGSGAAVLAVA
jgi:hypothetical protein